MSGRIEQLADGVTLMLGDCRELLPAIGRADHIITDPPYEAHMHASKIGAREIRTDGYDSPKVVDFPSIDGIRSSVTPLLVSACMRWLIIFCTPEGIAPWRDAIEAADARYKRACFWNKPDAAPQFNGQGPAMAAEAFVTAWCGSGHSSWNGGGRRNIFTHLTNQPDRHGAHPTEKPLPLMSEIIQLFTNAGDIVCDPFMGSGSTGVSAVRAGRQFIGIEVNPLYFEVACERISAALQQPDLFISSPRPIKQLGMDLG